MTHWARIRERAREANRAARALLPEGALTAEDLLGAADRLTGLTRIPLPAGDPLLFGTADALLHSGAIWYNADVAPWRARFYQAHEYAHYWLHGGASACSGSDMDGATDADTPPSGALRVEGYGPQQRRELEANVFAREFLLPADAAREWFMREGLGARQLSERVGLPERIVFHQLAHALLAPTREGAARAEQARNDVGAPPLDESQRRAATAPRGPVLVEAGPGTGKTSTLVGRVLYLLGERGAPPESILALTFSNKAAAEMRERVAAAAPEAAPRVWMGTFHAFGLELLRRYGTRVGLPDSPRVIDPVDSLLLLERSLNDLDLEHYKNLYDPSLNLRDMLGAVSRAKDELVGPEAYAGLAEQMRARAADEEAALKAEKAAEVARVYAFYQSRLGREGVLDFGDLMAKSVELLAAHPDVREAVRREYAHVLVDEYQDVNTASRMLLRHLAGGGEGLWVVGDVRQSVYRFRGAAPGNMRLFADDFPGAEAIPLEVNYRSRPEVVGVFSGLAAKMKAGGYASWRAHRSDAAGSVTLGVAEDETAEAEGVAREVERLRVAGFAYRDQAVLCRTHNALAAFGAALEREGVPVLYLGNLFERPEVRDLLSILTLASGPDGRGLVRVARFPEYDVPLSDVRVLLAAARRDGASFPAALDAAADSGEISARGAGGLGRLSEHLAQMGARETAWDALVHYLFNASSYLRHLLEDATPAGRQRRLALYQFLQFADETRGRAAAGGGDQKANFVSHVRRLEIYGEERQLRQVPAWAESVDAVRLLTVHASKGLEFRAVHLPWLGAGKFPSRRQGETCPPPEGMLAEGKRDWHEEEEECLFFVALSRARDALSLSRANRYGSQNSKPSPLLLHLSGLLPHPPDGPVTWPRREPAVEPPRPAPPEILPKFRERELDLYLDCPRQYYYEHVLGLGGRREDSAYVQFHLCVYRVLGWLRGQLGEGGDVSAASAAEELERVWAEFGPRDHPYERSYRREAEMMVERALGLRAKPRGRAAANHLEVPLTFGRVLVRPDSVEVGEDGGRPAVVLERMRTGRLSKSEPEKNNYALYHTAAELKYPGAARLVRVVYLSSGEEQEVKMSAKVIATRLGRYDQAMAGILAGEFAADPNDRRCPRCAHYFICPAAEDAEETARAL